MASRSADPKQLIHARIERSLIAKIDRYAKRLAISRSDALRRMLRRVNA
jgi:metal-responsive CopG/Arc/MetJ family transcriptional regulator